MWCLQAISISFMKALQRFHISEGSLNFASGIYEVFMTHILSRNLMKVSSTWLSSILTYIKVSSNPMWQKKRYGKSAKIGFLTMCNRRPPYLSETKTVFFVVRMFKPILLLYPITVKKVGSLNAFMQLFAGQLCNWWRFFVVQM